MITIVSIRQFGSNLLYQHYALLSDTVCLVQWQKFHYENCEPAQRTCRFNFNDRRQQIYQNGQNCLVERAKVVILEIYQTPRKTNKTTVSKQILVSNVKRKSSTYSLQSIINLTHLCETLLSARKRQVLNKLDNRS